MLDSCLLQYIPYKNGFDTTEITFGANLMCATLVIDIGKSNKMFKVERMETSKTSTTVRCTLRGTSAT